MNGLAVKVLWNRSGETDPKKRMEGLFPMVQEWHKKQVYDLVLFCDISYSAIMQHSNMGNQYYNHFFSIYVAGPTNSLSTVLLGYSLQSAGESFLFEEKVSP